MPTEAANGNIAMGRLIIDPPLDGATNMALDQALLESVDKSGIPVLRFYRWRRPTLSLGYFQRASQRRLHSPSLGLPMIRRSTGGGAIVHDEELTYSICVPLPGPWARRNLDLYMSTHRCIVSAFGEFGMKIARFADHPGGLELDQKSASDEPFLCFQRRTAEDLILSGYKVVGSAQRKSGRAVLQHGSILLAASRFAPELPGVAQLATIFGQVELEPLIAALADELSRQMHIRWVSSAATVDEQSSAEGHLNNRFQTQNWILRRP